MPIAREPVPCSEDGCDQPAKATKPQCETHYRRWRYANDPDYRARKRRENLAWRQENARYYQDYNRRLLETEDEDARRKRLSRVRNRHLVAKYGITAADYEVMWQNQGGLCLLCKQPETRQHYAAGTTNLLAVDHCATTGRVRGLLCTRCNRALGLFDHRPDLLKAAAQYLG